MKAKKAFSKFQHYETDKLKSINFPDVSKEGIAEIGCCSAIEYISDKMIYMSDKKSNTKKQRCYRHDFEKIEKTRLFLSADRNWLFIKLPKKATERGIEG